MEVKRGMSYYKNRWISLEGVLSKHTKIELHATIYDQDELALLFFELRTIGQFLPLGEPESDRLTLANAPFPYPADRSGR